MTETSNTELNAYHIRRNARLVKEISAQRPMSYEECIAQARRLAQQSRKQERKERN